MSTFPKIETMNPSEGGLASSGICPRCISRDGRRSSLSFSRIDDSKLARQCGHCKTVYVVDSDPIPILPYVLKPCPCGEQTEAYADGSSYCPHCGRLVEAQASHMPSWMSAEEMTVS